MKKKEIDALMMDPDVKAAAIKYWSVVAARIQIKPDNDSITYNPADPKYSGCSECGGPLFIVVERVPDHGGYFCRECFLRLPDAVKIYAAVIILSDIYGGRAGGRDLGNKIAAALLT
jgi:hypothetical protein